MIVNPDFTIFKRSGLYENQSRKLENVNPAGKIIYFKRSQLSFENKEWSLTGGCNSKFPIEYILNRERLLSGWKPL
jgi:hypothetical protein